MRDSTIRLLFVSLFVFTAVSVASAQLAVGTKLRANIPFDFIVNAKTFPAGDYTFERTTDIREPRLLVLRGRNGASVLDTVRDESSNGYLRTGLVFDYAG